MLPSVDEVVETLRKDGYAIVPDMWSGDDVARARSELERILETVPTGRVPFEGYKTRRVYALFAKTRALDPAAIHPLVLGVLDQLLVDYELSAPTGIQIGPGEIAQALHPDDATYPIPRPHDDLVVTVMWPLQDFTVENGATRIVPGSHRWVNERPGPDTETIPAVMPAGSAMFYLGALWHGGGANQTDEPRLGVVLQYGRAWLRPIENHFLGVPPETVRELPERLQELLGYNICPPFMGYVDGRHPRKTLEGATS